MRVIAGSARRLLLSAPAGLETRPTSDKIKETLFNMIAPDIYSDTVFLDLFSGSGGIGIEALSRGAKRAVFVERSKAALDCIKKNLATTHFTDSADIYAADVMTALRQMERRYKFDIIFMDPPYEHGYEKEVLYYLSSSDLLADDGLIIVEASDKTDFDYVASDKSLGFTIDRIKSYKSSVHVFIKKQINK